MAKKIAPPATTTSKRRTTLLRPRATAAAATGVAPEAIRVVPLHHPKPAYTIDELARARADAGGDFFDGKPHPAALSARLTYRGGALLTSVQVYVVYWGTKWSGASGTAMMKKLNAFFQTVVTSPLMDQLSEYSVPGKAIGHGAFTGSTVITAQAPTSSVTDTTIQTRLKGWISARTVPRNNPNTLYFIFLDPGVVSVMGGSRSCTSYCGYHNNAGTVFYALMPYPTCSGCLGNLDAFNALTGTSSHELCEAVTDPVPGTGWYDDTNGEIGDICAWSFRQVSGYTVQLEWSNAQGKCV